MQLSIRTFFDHRQALHAPARELHNGSWADYAETAQRAEAISASFDALEAPHDFGEQPIAAVHSTDYLTFLKSAAARWREAGRAGDAIGYVWPIVRRRPLRFDRIDAEIGRYSLDAATPVAEDTWVSAYWGAQTAIAATEAVLANGGAAFALCRPPGHHAGSDYLGGYCYLNNVAIAAQRAIAAGHERVSILDVDYHHGNGTQDIFWERGDVQFVSLHADPRTDYPFYWGHADECGEGVGEGSTLNLPLPRGTGIDPYLAALERGLAAIAEFRPTLLFVSFGADTYAGDPISHFKLETADYLKLGAAIQSLGLPTVIVMEGGYAINALGQNTAAFLKAF